MWNMSKQAAEMDDMQRYAGVKNYMVKVGLDTS